MNWLTPQQVRNAAVTSPMAAAYCSMIHWNQILEAGPLEYDTHVSATFCGLCQSMYHKGKGKWVCPLNKHCCTDIDTIVPSFVCCPEYYAAVQAIRCDLDTNHIIGEQQDEWYIHTRVIIMRLIERIRDVLPTLQ